MTDLKKHQIDEINKICSLATTGHILAVKSKGIYGFFIRRFLSKGLHSCYTNHNAPIYAFGGKMMTLQITTPKSYEESLRDYLVGLYRDGGCALLLCPDHFYKNGIKDAVKKRLTARWRAMDGMPYDKTSIRMFFRMVFRKKAHILANDKKKIYCTEGTVNPLLEDPHNPWTPDVLMHEEFPSPIHIEHCIRQKRLIYLAGNDEIFRKILKRQSLKNF